MALLEVVDLVKHFPGPGRGLLGRRQRVRAVDGVSFQVHPGETLGLVGESGCGKTTVARLVLRLLEPTSGRIGFAGRDVTRVRGHELKALRRDVQMVFQDPRSSLNPRHRVGAIVEAPLAVHGVGTEGSERRSAVDRLLVQVGLGPEHRDRFPHELSDGQRQRVGIARALAPGPRLLVADEPVSALDVSVQAQVLDVLIGLRRDLGLTMLFITHDLAVARHVCDRVAVMYLGRLVEVATADELFERPRHPYTRLLLDSVPVPDPAVRATVPSSVGEPASPSAPPPGCRFHPRCPRAGALCPRVEPALEAKPGGGLAACHFPL